MNKGIEWLREQIKNEMNGWSGGNPDYFRGAEDAYEDVKDWLNQLDEPEVLSQGWIDKNVVHVRGLGDVIEAETVENLLVPKQEEFESKIKVLSQEFIDKYKVDYGNWVPSVPIVHLENLLVPKQPFCNSEELPVIPKFVAEWIDAERGTMSNWKLPSRFISDTKYKKDQRRYKWSQVEGNMDKFMSALIIGYEVEERELTVKEVIEEHIELLKKQEVAVNLKPYYDLWEELKDE